MSRKLFILSLIVTLALLTTTSALASPLPGTAFSFHGYLALGGAPVTNTCDFGFRMYDALTGGTKLGVGQYVSAVQVTSGGYTVWLNRSAEFGPNAINGEARWLEIWVRCPAGTGNYTLVPPRVPLTVVPYSLYSLNADLLDGQHAGSYALASHNHDATYVNEGQTDGILTSMILDGTLLFADWASNGCVTGQFPQWNGSAWACASSSTDADTLDSLHAGAFWQVGGNSTGADAILGTLDNFALDILVNNSRVLRLEPDATSPNLIGGYGGNLVGEGVFGATIAGGGSSGAIHTVNGNYGTVGGGIHNTAGALDATVCGGDSNTASESYSTVGGGTSNTAGGQSATVAGGWHNIATTSLAAIGGGRDNSAAYYATIGGGYSNNAGGNYSTIGGGYDNTASGAYAAIPGGAWNLASGIYSFAAGKHAQAVTTGSFVWADSQDTDFASTAANQFAVRANGGALFELGTGNFTIHGGTRGIDLTGTDYGLYALSSGTAAVFGTTTAPTGVGGYFSNSAGGSALYAGGNTSIAGALTLTGPLNGGTPWTSANDGSASTLDADLLDGQHASAFALAAHNHDAAYVNEGQADSIKSSMILNSSLLFEDLASNGCSNGQIPKWNGTVWACAADNGGPDADTLDGQHGSYYLNATNLNAGTLGTIYYSAYNDLGAEGYLGNAASDLALNNGILQSTLNADLLDGLHASSLATSTHNHWGQSWSGSDTGLTLSGGTNGLNASGSGQGVNGSGSTGIYGSGSAYGVVGTSVNGVGVFAQSNSNTTAALWGQNFGAGVGIYGQGSSHAGWFQGNVYVSGNFTVGGTKSGLVKTNDYGVRTLYAVESPENWFEDFGAGQLTDGVATITIEPIFAQTVNLTTDYHVFLTPLGDCMLYVAEKTETTFTVRASAGQTCSIAFDYRIVAKRLGYEDIRLEEVTLPDAPTLLAPTPQP
jgi:hypothetical protein